MKHEEYHIREKGKEEKAMLWSVAIISVFIVIEMVGAYLSNSLALFSDALHLLTDAAALSIALGGFIISRKKPTETFSYGYNRISVIAAFVNALMWFGIFAYIIYEAVDRLINPYTVDIVVMMPIAIAGLIVNLIIFKVLHSHHDHDNINMRGAILHVLMDIIGSVGAIIGGVVIYFTEWYTIDAIISVVLASLILRSGWLLLYDSYRILMMGKPDAITHDVVEKTIISELEGIRDVHHIHIWELGSGQIAMTLHLSILDDTDCNRALYECKELLGKKWGVMHSTIQVEHSPVCPDEELFYDL